MTLNQTVTRYAEADHDLVSDFIMKAANVEKVDEEIIKNSILVKLGTRLVGMIAFEKHEQIGIIRYFIYEQYTLPDLLVNLFFELYAYAKELEVSQLVTVATDPSPYQLFELLGFIEIKNSIEGKISELVDGDSVKVMSIKL